MNFETFFGTALIGCAVCGIAAVVMIARRDASRHREARNARRREYDLRCATRN